jgi:hypothetical protein
VLHEKKKVRTQVNIKIKMHHNANPNTFSISTAAGRSLASFVRHLAIKSWKRRDLKSRIQELRPTEV